MQVGKQGVRESPSQEFGWEADGDGGMETGRKVCTNYLSRLGMTGGKAAEGEDQFQSQGLLMKRSDARTEIG